MDRGSTGGAGRSARLRKLARSRGLVGFYAITQAWLASVEFEIKRIGFALQALLPADGLASANRLLQKNISIKIDAESTTDFLYQINRPVASRILPEIKLNRLMKWSAPLLQLFRTQLQLTPGMATTTPLAGKYFASSESDINTPAEHEKPLERALLEAIYDELVDLALQKLERGDRE